MKTGLDRRKTRVILALRNNGFEGALNDLESGLKAASTPGPHLREPQERAAAGAALTTILKFMHDLGCAPEIQKPLIALSAALQDLQHGKIGPITKPLPRGPGRPPNTALYNDRILLGAIVIDAYLKAGLSAPEAKSRFSSRARMAGIKTTGAQAFRWRLDVMGAVKAPTMLNSFNKMISKFPEQPELLLRHGDSLLDNVLLWT